MLRLVHPAPDGGQAPRPPKGRRSAALLLTPEEVRHFRAALRNIIRAFGSTACLAAAVGLPVDTLYGAARRPLSAALALRVARAAGMHVEALLSGQLSEAGRCQACGARVGAERRSA